MTKRATDDVFDGLHALTAETLMSEIQAYRNGERTDSDGKRLPVPPALLAQASKFLKDNGIDSPARAADLKDKLAGSLPTFDDVQEASGAAH